MTKTLEQIPEYFLKSLYKRTEDKLKDHFELNNLKHLNGAWLWIYQDYFCDKGFENFKREIDEDEEFESLRNRDKRFFDKDNQDIISVMIEEYSDYVFEKLSEMTPLTIAQMNNRI